MRLFGVIIWVWFSAFNAFGQESDQDTLAKQDRIRIYSGFRFGFGGASQSNTIINEEAVNMVVNPTMGGVLWIRFRQNFGLMAEAQYSLKGFKFTQSLGDTSLVTSQRYHFIEFPLLVHASIGNNRFTEFLEFGLAPAFLSGGYTETTPYLDGQSLNATYDKIIFNKPNPAPFKRFDLNMVIGAGLGVKIGPGMLHSGVRMHIGMVDINKDQRFGYDDRPQQQRNFYLNFGYLWHIHSIR